MKLHLPAYMIPNHYIKVPEMRLTASNKLDTKYLKSEFTKNILTLQHVKILLIKKVLLRMLYPKF